MDAQSPRIPSPAAPGLAAAGSAFARAGGGAGVHAACSAPPEGSRTVESPLFEEKCKTRLSLQAVKCPFIYIQKHLLVTLNV